ncbi:MAG: hypothetical protein Q9218_004236 [Villophora microphyllina]
MVEMEFNADDEDKLAEVKESWRNCRMELSTAAEDLISGPVPIEPTASTSTIQFTPKEIDAMRDAHEALKPVLAAYYNDDPISISPEIWETLNTLRDTMLERFEIKKKRQPVSTAVARYESPPPFQDYVEPDSHPSEEAFAANKKIMDDAMKIANAKPVYGSKHVPRADKGKKTALFGTANDVQGNHGPEGKDQQ